MQQRYSIIEKSGDVIYFEPIKNKPHSLFVLDITDDPENWQNTTYSLFFDMPHKSVELKKNNK